MKILVTGASGYLGQGIVKHLLDNNHRVIAIGRKPERIDNRAERIAADIFSTAEPYKAFGEPDVESEIEDEAMPDWSNDPQCRGFHYIYSFSYHGHTYKKIIFVVVGAAWAGVSGIEYVVE